MVPLTVVSFASPFPISIARDKHFQGPWDEKGILASLYIASLKNFPSSQRTLSITEYTENRYVN